MASADSTNLNQLRQLRAFCHAAQTGSVSKAADRLRLSQPSVSLQIQALEKSLNTLLFERCGPKITLTPAGELLLEMAQPLVDGFSKLADSFTARLDDVHTGPLDIASGEATLLYVLPEVIKSFSTEYPQIDVRLHNVTGHDGLALLRNNDVDFAVGSMIDVPDDMVYHPIYHYTPALIMCKDHPLAEKESVTLEDISPHGLILPPRHLSTWSVVDLVFQQHSVPYNVVLEAGGWEVIKRYVEMGIGISIVTSICLRGFENLLVRPMGHYFPNRSYGVVVRRGKFLSPQAKQFLQLMDGDFFARQTTAPPRKRKSTHREDALITNL